MAGRRGRVDVPTRSLPNLELPEVYAAMKQAKEKLGLVIVDGAYVENVAAVISGLRAAGKKTHVVVLSASPNWQQAREAFEAGASDYLPKGMTEEELLAAFDEILGKEPPPLREKEKAEVGES